MGTHRVWIKRKDGIRQRYLKNYGFTVQEEPIEERMRKRRGYTDIVEIDANKFKNAWDEGHPDEPLAWNPLRLDAAKEREVYDSYAQVNLSPYSKVGVLDGRHRIAAAAEKGQRIKVAVPPNEKEEFEEMFA